MKQSINHLYQPQQFQHVSIKIQSYSFQKHKMIILNINQNLIYSNHYQKIRLYVRNLKFHIQIFQFYFYYFFNQQYNYYYLNNNYNYYNKQHRRIQQIKVEPEIKVDELKEHKWQILSQNCQYLLELSRQILDKPNYEQLYRSTSNPRLNPLFLEHDKTLKSNINCNSKQIINNQQTNPIQTKFSLIQHSKKRSSNQSFNINNNINIIVTEKPILKKHQSLHVSPTHQSQTSQSSTKFFFAKLNQVSSNAYNLQRRLKKEQFDEIKQTNEKVVCIRSDFDKFSKMLNESQQD